MISPFNRAANRDSERLINQLKVTQPVRDGMGFEFRVQLPRLKF